MNKYKSKAFASRDIRWLAVDKIFFFIAMLAIVIFSADSQANDYVDNVRTASFGSTLIGAGVYAASHYGYNYSRKPYNYLYSHRPRSRYYSPRYRSHYYGRPYYGKRYYNNRYYGHGYRYRRHY